MKAFLLCLGLAMVVGAVLSAGAGASVKCAPPGVSGVTEYYEVLPGDSCNLPAPRVGKTPGTGGGSFLSGVLNGAGIAQPVSRARRTHAGGASAAVNRLVGLTGSAPAGARNFPPAPASAGRSFFSALVHPFVSGDGPGGTGILSPVIVIATAVLVLLGRREHRRRKARRPSAPH